MRILFAGTPDFAVAALDALLESDHEVVAVYTQPDRPAGRGRRTTPPPVKVRAQEAGLPVHQPEDLRDPAEQQRLAGLGADLGVVVAYGLLLPRAVLDLLPLGWVNLHASRLPRWRGAAPIQRALLAGDRETGVDLMQMSPGLDTGPVLAETVVPIGPRETGGELHDRLAAAGAELLRTHLDDLAAGRLEATPQPEEGATYAARIDPAEATLDWDRPAAELDRLVRAFHPWPTARTTAADGSALKVHAAEPRDEAAAAEPGTVLAATPEGVDVATGEGVLRLTRLQAAGGRPMAAGDFLNGRRELVAPGSRLGEQ
ncbi:MAG: methionyl-tRNA formyltransferase [Thiohalospira sp.]